MRKPILHPMYRPDVNVPDVCCIPREFRAKAVCKAGFARSDSAPEGSDLAAIADEYIAVTPLHYDLTQDGALAATAQAFSD